MQAADGSETINRGTGQFISIYLAPAGTQPEVHGTATRRKQQMLRAVGTADVEVLRNGVDKEQRKRSVHRILSVAFGMNVPTPLAAASDGMVAA